MARTSFIPHDEDREDQKIEEKAERRALRRAPTEDVEDTELIRFGSKDPDAEEYDSIDGFVEFIYDNEESEFDHFDIQCLNARLGSTAHAIRKTLEGYGLRLKHRSKESSFRTFGSNPHDRFIAYPSHGGGGGSSIVGLAG